MADSEPLATELWASLIVSKRRTGRLHDFVLGLSLERRIASGREGIKLCLRESQMLYGPTDSSQAAGIPVVLTGVGPDIEVRTSMPAIPPDVGTAWKGSFAFGSSAAGRIGVGLAHPDPARGMFTMAELEVLRPYFRVLTLDDTSSCLRGRAPCLTSSLTPIPEA